MRLLLISISEDINNMSAEVFLYLSLRRRGDSEILRKGLEGHAADAGAGIRESHITLLYFSD